LNSEESEDQKLVPNGFFSAIRTSNS